MWLARVSSEPARLPVTLACSCGLGFQIQLGFASWPSSNMTVWQHNLEVPGQAIPITENAPNRQLLQAPPAPPAGGYAAAAAPATAPSAASAPAAEKAEL